jgi:hypothetical protein
MGAFATGVFAVGALATAAFTTTFFAGLETGFGLALLLVALAIFFSARGFNLVDFKTGCPRVNVAHAGTGAQTEVVARKEPCRFIARRG